MRHSLSFPPSHSVSRLLSRLLLLHRAALKCFTFMEMWPNLTLRLAGSTCSPFSLTPSLPTSTVALCRLLGGLGKIQSAQLFDKLQRQRTNERRAAQQEKRLKLFMNSASTPSWLFLDSTWTCTWSGNFALTGIGTDGRADGRRIGSGIALSQVNNLKP